MDIATVKEGFELMERGMRKLGGGPFDYYVTRLTECYDLLIGRFAPFKIGDRVILVETPEITETKSPGWYSSRHFLVKGEAGVVREVEVDGRGFSAAVEFDNETWLPDTSYPQRGIVKGVPQPVSNKHTYHFGERWLVKIPEQQIK